MSWGSLEMDLTLTETHSWLTPWFQPCWDPEQSPLPYRVWTSGLENNEVMNEHCFGTLSLWWFALQQQTSACPCGSLSGLGSAQNSQEERTAEWCCAGWVGVRQERSELWRKHRTCRETWEQRISTSPAHGSHPEVKHNKPVTCHSLGFWHNLSGLQSRHRDFKNLPGWF